MDRDDMRPAYECLISEGRIDRRHEPTLMRMKAVIEVGQGFVETSPELKAWFDELWDHVLREGLPVLDQYLVMDLTQPFARAVESEWWLNHADDELNELCVRVSALLASAPPRPTTRHSSQFEPTIPPLQSNEIDADVSEITAFLRRAAN